MHVTWMEHGPDAARKFLNTSQVNLVQLLHFCGETDDLLPPEDCSASTVVHQRGRLCLEIREAT